MRVSTHTQTPYTENNTHNTSEPPKVTLICDIERNELDYLVIEYHNYSTTTTTYVICLRLHVTTAPMSLSAARFSAAQPSFQQHSLAKNTGERSRKPSAHDGGPAHKRRSPGPHSCKLSFREPNGLPSSRPQPVVDSPAGSMRRRILDGLVTSPVTIEPILEGSPLL